MLFPPLQNHNTPFRSVNVNREIYLFHLIFLSETVMFFLYFFMEQFSI